VIESIGGMISSFGMSMPVAIIMIILLVVVSYIVLRLLMGLLFYIIFFAIVVTGSYFILSYFGIWGF
jgi:hypothetical protein